MVAIFSVVTDLLGNQNYRQNVKKRLPLPEDSLEP